MKQLAGSIEQLAELCRTHGDAKVIEIINNVADRMQVADRICSECGSVFPARGAWADDRGYLCYFCAMEILDAEEENAGRAATPAGANQKNSTQGQKNTDGTGLSRRNHAHL